MAIDDTSVKPESGRETRDAVRRGSRRMVVAGLIVVAIVVLAGLGTYRLIGRLGSGRPNVLLITMDTTRADYLGCYGHPGGRTPNVDRLAREGALLARCVTPSPLTLPSHASIMTGVYPFVHGVRQNGAYRLADAHETLAEAMKESAYATRATVASYVLNERFGMGQGFDVYNDVLTARQGKALEAERKGTAVADDAVAMLGEVADRPFFMWVHFYDPHDPYESSDHPDTLSIAAYEDEVALMDQQIGRILSELERLGLTERTIVALVADHGEGLGDDLEVKHGLFLKEYAIHTPLIFRYPGVIPGGQRVEALVRTIDVAATLLDLAGLPELKATQGVSLGPLMLGEREDLNLVAYSEGFQTLHQYGLSPLRSLTSGEWKYVLAPKPELYYLPDDPGEKRNLADGQAELAADMHQALRDLIATAPAPPSGADAEMSLSPKELATLQALGYASATERLDQSVPELERFEPKGGNPLDLAPLIKAIMLDVPVHLNKREFREAEMLLRQGMEAMPKSGRMLAGLADMLHDQGRREEALEVIEQAVEMSPDDHILRMKYGNSLGALQRHAEALVQFEKIINQFPHDTAALQQAAMALIYLGRYEDAETHVRAALEVEPDNVHLLMAVGLVGEQVGQLEAAAAYFEEALAIDPDYAPCKEGLRRVRQKMWAGE